MVACLASLLAGVICAAWAPVVQFALSIVVLMVLGIGLALFDGASAGAALGWGLAVFACAQVGYGIGLLALTTIRARRPVWPAVKPETDRAARQGAMMNIGTDPKA